MWSSAAVAHLLQGSMCCVFRDAPLHTSVVMSALLSYCCLYQLKPVWPFSSDLWNFRPQNCCLLDIFSFFGPFSVNPRDVELYVKKSQEISIFWNTQDEPIWHQHAWFWCSVFGLQLVLTISVCLNSLSCCHVIGWERAVEQVYLITWPMNVLLHSMYWMYVWMW